MKSGEKLIYLYYKMKSAGITPFRYNQGRLEALVCIGVGGAQNNKILSFGGAIEIDEKSDVAALRELHEESGMHLNGNQVTRDRISPCTQMLFPQQAGRHQFFHYYLMIHSSDVVTFEIPSHQFESKAVDTIAGVQTEPITGTMQRSRVAWVPVDILIGRQDVFENFQEVLIFQPDFLPPPENPSAFTMVQQHAASASAPAAAAASAAGSSVLSEYVPASVACPQCTFLNSSDKTKCEICGFEFTLINQALVQAFAQMIQKSKKGKKTKIKKRKSRFFYMKKSKK